MPKTTRKKIINQPTELPEIVTYRKKEGRLGLIIIITLAILLAYWIRVGVAPEIRLAKPETEFQAIFLSNGQVYFGSILAQNQEEIILSDIYYFSSPQKLQNNTGDDTLSDTFSLVKLGAELHGPQDLMRINRKHILFTEDLREDSRVVNAIKEYVKQNQDK